MNCTEGHMFKAVYAIATLLFALTAHAATPDGCRRLEKGAGFATVEERRVGDIVGFAWRDERGTIFAQAHWNLRSGELIVGEPLPRGQSEEDVAENAMAATLLFAGAKQEDLTPCK